jgi:hypothetical protein
MVDSVFGIGTMRDMDGEEMPCIYVSDKSTWKEEGCCSNFFEDDSYEVLCGLGFVEEQEGIWSSSDPMNLPINYHKRLVDAGFTYDPDFESFMRYGDNEEDEDYKVWEEEDDWDYEEDDDWE